MAAIGIRYLGIIVTGYVGKRRINTISCNLRPCRIIRSAVKDALQVVAVIERTIADTRYAVGYGDTCQAAATLERIPADTHYAIGYGDACQPAAIGERIIEDARHALGYYTGFTALY
jgi:hypothetical protein